MRVVRAMRAGEAKLRGRMTSDVPIAGPPGCWDRRVFPHCLSHRFCCYLHGFNCFLVFLLASSSFFAVIYMGFKELLFSLFDSTILREHDLQKLK